MSATPQGKAEVVVQKARDGNPIPRAFSILRKDLINFGYTPGCPGCREAANDLKHKAHTFECRVRLEKAMLEDEMGSNRIKEAKAREDALLEQQVRIADEASRPMIPMRQIEIEVATPPTPVAGEPRIVDSTMPDNTIEPHIRDPPSMSLELMLEEHGFQTS